MANNIRIGVCSICGCALEKTGNGQIRARSASINKQPGRHHHKDEWHIVPDEEEINYDRYWHDFVPGFVR